MQFKIKFFRSAFTIIKIIKTLKIDKNENHKINFNAQFLF